MSITPGTLRSARAIHEMVDRMMVRSGLPADSPAEHEKSVQALAAGLDGEASISATLASAVEIRIDLASIQTGIANTLAVVHTVNSVEMSDFLQAHRTALRSVILKLEMAIEKAQL